MDLLKFRDRVKSYKLAKGQNPLLNYWDWKLQSFADGGETDSKIIDTLDSSRVKDSKGISLKLTIENLHNKFPNEPESNLKPFIDNEKEWYDYLITEGSGYADAGLIPEVTIKPDLIYTYLDTYYPVTNKLYKYTGHSKLSHDGLCIDKGGKNNGYNLVTNNCADATLGALLLISGKKANPFLFTTPGDVRDFALEKLSGEVVLDRKGLTRVRIPINATQSKKLREYIISGKTLREFADGGEVKEWNPNITGEGYDDKGYYAQAMNQLPEIQVYGNKNIDKSEINRTHTDVPYYNYRFDNINVQPGRGALEIVSPEFDLISGVRGAVNLLSKNNKLPKFIKKLDKGLNDKDLIYHLDKGDINGAFSNNGAFIKDNKLYPGKANIANQKNYIWFNENKPYTMSINGLNLNRAIIANKKDINNLIRVRDSKEQIGQWTGNKGFVLKSEMVTDTPINIDKLSIYNKKHIPIIGDYWIRK